MVSLSLGKIGKKICQLGGISALKPCGRFTATTTLHHVHKGFAAPAAHLGFHGRLTATTAHLGFHGIITATTAHLGFHVIEGFTSTTLLLEEFEGSLLGDVSSPAQVLDSLLSSGMLPAAYNAAVFGTHEIFASETTGSMFGISIPYLKFGADSWHFGTTHHHVVIAIVAVVAIFARHHIVTSVAVSASVHSF